MSATKGSSRDLTPSNYPAEPAGGTSLSTLDILLAIAGLLALAGTALAIRRLTHTPT
ncbi:MAG: hypothetical protein ACRDJ3_10280 [Solirubrobacteraceae bacterium]